MADWSTPVDLYCERTDPSLWAEPANAASNAAFLVAALAAFMVWRRDQARDWPALVLIALTAIVGLGSLAFHTVATRGAILLDIVPIAGFIYGYFLLALRRFLRLSPVIALAVLAAFIAGSRAFEGALPAGFLNGSGGYLPALAAMVAIGAMVRESAAGRMLFIAAAVFTASLVFRTIDNAVCGLFPLGTHFLWHLLNALVLYLLLRAAMGARVAGAAPGTAPG